MDFKKMDDYFFMGMNISAAGLEAQRKRMDVIANNIANMYSTRTAAGGPFRRDIVVFEEVLDKEMAGGVNSDAYFSGRGVRVAQIRKDLSPLREVYQPGHPDADQNGIVRYPNVDPVVEMVDMIAASRAYEASVTAIQSSKSMMKSALSIAK